MEVYYNYDIDCKGKIIHVETSSKHAVGKEVFLDWDIDSIHLMKKTKTWSTRKELEQTNEI